MICRLLVFYYLGFLFLMSLPHLHIHFYFDYRNIYGNYKLIWSILPCLIMETKQLRRTYLYLKGNNVKWFEQKKYFSTESTKVFQDFFQLLKRIDPLILEIWRIITCSSLESFWFERIANTKSSEKTYNAFPIYGNKDWKKRNHSK